MALFKWVELISFGTKIHKTALEHVNTDGLTYRMAKQHIHEQAADM